MINDDSKWAYWVRAAAWNEFQAALILDGIIPSEYTIHEMTHHGWAFEPTVDDLRKQIKMRFEKSDRINPSECLTWAIENGLQLCTPLLEEAEKIALVKAPKQNSQGKHWEERRQEICLKAFKFLDALSSDALVKLIHKKKLRNSINISKLAEEMNDHSGAIWPNETPPSLKLIYNSLAEACPRKVLNKDN